MTLASTANGGQTEGKRYLCSPDVVPPNKLQRMHNQKFDCINTCFLGFFFGGGDSLIVFSLSRL